MAEPATWKNGLFLLASGALRLQPIKMLD